MRGIKLAFLFVLLPALTVAQNFEDWAYEQGLTSKRDWKKMARQAEIFNKPQLSIFFYEKLHDQEPNKTKYIEKLSVLNTKVKNYEQALTYTELLCSQDSSTENILRLSSLLMQTGSYKEAEKLLYRLMEVHLRKNYDRDIKKKAENLYQGCQWEKQKDSLIQKQFIVLPIKDLNTAYSEQSPRIFRDQLYLLRFNEPPQHLIPPGQSMHVRQNLIIAERNGRNWSYLDTVEIYLPPGQDLFLGSFHPVNDTLALTGLCHKNNKGSTVCHLYSALFTGDRLQDFKKLPEPINIPDHSSTQPFGYIDEEEEELKVYFTSDRPGGKGGRDLYYFEYKLHRDRYSKPRNLGFKINTPYDEGFAFYKPGQLYFSSNGHPGFGGYDIYKTPGEKTSFEEPVPVFEVNSSYDDMAYQQLEDSTQGVLLSNRPKEDQLYGKGCCDDVYRFHIKNPNEGHVPFVVKERQSGIVLTDAYYKVKLDSSSASSSFIHDTTETGYFNLPLDTTKTYNALASKEGYLNGKVVFGTAEMQKATKENPIEIRLIKITDEEILLENIYYKFDKSDLTEKAKQTIVETIYQVLRNNPDLRVQLNSHTDSKGTLRYNYKLSKARAKSVVDYLIMLGIDPGRLESKGYGETKPVANNVHPDGSDNPEGRALNRRTTFTILD